MSGLLGTLTLVLVLVLLCVAVPAGRAAGIVRRVSAEGARGPHYTGDGWLAPAADVADLADGPTG